MLHLADVRQMVAGALALTACAACPLSIVAAEQSTPPETLELLGVIRDFPPNSEHPDFLVNPSATPGARSSRNIGLTLDADYKPVYVGGGKRVNQEYRDAQNNKIAWCAPPAPGDTTGSFSSDDNGGIVSQATFAQWFRDVPGVNLSRPWSITLTRDSAGVYEYDTSNFHPIDHQLLGNGPDEHNFYFTYEITASFTASPGQFVNFTGDDDCWIFIDNRLVIDHGGIVANREQHFTLDRLALTPGESYEMRFFFAERKQPQSQFRIRTNIDSMSTGVTVAVLDLCD